MLHFDAHLCDNLLGALNLGSYGVSRGFTFCAKLYDRKNALVAADLLNDRVSPFFAEHETPLPRVLTDRGTKFFATRRFAC